jgi:hypothetical protein
MKVLFLDIDGVLNSKLWNESHQNQLRNGKCIDETKVQLLANIVKKTEALIVLHSGWRFWLDDNLKPLQYEARYLIELFYKYNLKIYDKTPDLATDEIRKMKKFSLVKADEILLWLKKHDSLETYIVIDDLKLHNEQIEKHLILTDPAVGLTEKDVKLVIQYFNEYQACF